jgi:hypothetical protein
MNLEWRTMKLGSAIPWMAFAWVVALAAPVSAAEYESGFGFGISVPDVWLVLTRSEVIESAENFFADSGEESGEGPGQESGDRGSRALAKVPLAMRQDVFERVRSGEMEMFYRLASEPVRFVDNVNVMKQSANLPNTPEQVLAICRALPTEFSRIFGRPIAVDVCEMRERIGRRALYLQFDGAVPGTTTLHYQLQHGFGETLVFTATTVIANLPSVMGEFEGMISSIRLH